MSDITKLLDGLNEDDINKILREALQVKECLIKYIESLNEKHAHLSDAYINYLKIKAGIVSIDDATKNQDHFQNEFMTMLLFIDSKYPHLIEAAVAKKELQLNLIIAFDGWMLHKSAVDPETLKCWNLYRKE